MTTLLVKQKPAKRGAKVKTVSTAAETRYTLATYRPANHPELIPVVGFDAFMAVMEQSAESGESLGATARKAVTPCP